MSWFRALKESSRSGLTLERKRLEPLIALRGAAGLGITIWLSLWALGPEAAASSAFGAFQAAIATFQRSWRPRPELALVSGATLAVSTFLGYLTIPWLPLFLALLALWTFVAGLSWAVGPTAGLIASSNVAMMLVTVTLPTSVADAAVHAATMVAGGLVQAALIVLVPVRRWRAHRDVLADALAAEAGYARRLREDPVAPFDPAPLMEARDASALTRRQARRRPAGLRGTRGVAERIRPVLASLADPAVGVPPEGPARDRARELLGAAADVLDATAEAVRDGTPVDLPPAAVAAFRTPDTGSILRGAPYRAAVRLGRLLQDVVEAAGGEPSAGPRPTGHLRRPSLLALVPVAARAMGDELHRSSPISRHAVRVTVVACLGYLLGTALPFGHGYWAPLAAVMIMRPDFSQTYSRAVARFAGTVVGVAAATGVLQVAGPDPEVSGVLAVLSAALNYLVLRTGQFAVQMCTSAYVVFLLGMGGQQWTQTVPERVLLTLLGGVLAMVAYAVYPAWETPRLRDRLADWLAAQGRYAAAVLRHYAEPSGEAVADVREALLTARAARAGWHAAVARAAGEPVRHRGLSRAAADDAEDALIRTGRVAMLLEAHLPDRGAAPVPAAVGLADALHTATETGARAVRERRVPHWTAVRAALEDPGWAATGDEVLREGGRLLLRHLTELSEALDPVVPPTTTGGGQDGPRRPKGPGAGGRR
ncbi:FUSC family protein [Streptomyces sp. NPDC093094]|uniref:FUSC family protein n=1 Tax=Streptomyces sp. NPDC093094 TaxID=3366026 RepID=UPI00380694A4